MTFNKAKRSSIEKTIEQSLRKKFQNYKPETNGMPFHYRLLGRDRMALYSFIQSLNTHFGTSIYEPVAEILAQMKGEAKRQYVLGEMISKDAQFVIQDIMNRLSVGEDTDCEKETERIREVAQKPPFKKLKAVRADLFLKENSGDVHLFDLKTVKPNKSSFENFKRTLLEWRALYLKDNPHAQIHSYIAIPYNPYHPKPYSRWTMKGMLDVQRELKVAEEFWDFLGGDNSYEELLDCFEKVGCRMRGEIDCYFENYR